MTPAPSPLGHDCVWLGLSSMLIMGHQETAVFDWLKGLWAKHLYLDVLIFPLGITCVGYEDVESFAHAHKVCCTLLH